MKSNFRTMWNLTIAGALCLLLGGCSASRPPGVFDTPEQAVQALSELIGKHDAARIEAMFGPGSVELFASGDPAADDEDFGRVKQLISEGVSFEEHDADTRIALFGTSEWPWPIPLVREGERWRFDTEKGREELLNRRIGANELWTLASLHEYVDAQREYRSASRDGNPPAYAQRFRSTEGKRDGLYWPVQEGEPESPLGDLLAESEAAASSEPRPYHGYLYRILTAQGPSAPGGERSYLDAEGRMSGGFAVVAWPAKYGNSGVMSFQVNHQGIVFQRDLGADTATLAAAITRYDPDSEWVPTGDSIESADDTAVTNSNINPSKEP